MPVSSSKMHVLFQWVSPVHPGAPNLIKPPNLTHCSLVTPWYDIDQDNIGSGKGLSDDTIGPFY